MGAITDAIVENTFPTVIKHGIYGKKLLIFSCESCGCVFFVGAKNSNVLLKDKVYSCKCPECDEKLFSRKAAEDSEEYKEYTQNASLLETDE